MKPDLSIVGCQIPECRAGKRGALAVILTVKEQRRNVCSTLLLYAYVVRLMPYVGLVLGIVAVTLNVYCIEKVIDAFHFFGSV